MSSLPFPSFSPPSSILIIGSGVFGLSTALSLARRPIYANTSITLLDRAVFPAHDGSSIDSSRIIRADYSSASYAALAARAQTVWRADAGNPEALGGDGRYTENGLVLVTDEDPVSGTVATPGAGTNSAEGLGYVEASFRNVKAMMHEAGDESGVQELRTRRDIEEAVGTGGGSGTWGYVNRRSGWADATASMRWLRKQVEETGRVQFVRGEATTLLKSDGDERGCRKVVGARLRDGSSLKADLVILATGAWTGALVDLRGRAAATGQVLAYIELTEEEEARLIGMPVLLNMGTGMFIIPPRPGSRELKVARHAYGYSNPRKIRNPDREPGVDEMIEVSLPRTSADDPTQRIPPDGEAACRQALQEMVPWLGGRAFVKTRICWYTDTPKGDFLFCYHPDVEGLFLATGGSGHGFKFLPVIGDVIADCVERRCPPEFAEKWAWPLDAVDRVVTEDGSRGGKMGEVLLAGIED